MRNRQDLRPDAPLETSVLQDDQLDAVTGGTPGCSLAAAAGGPSAARGRRIIDCEGSAFLADHIF